MSGELVGQLKRHEGLRTKPYRCIEGYLTVGYGLNLDEGITENEAHMLLVNKLNALWHELNNEFNDVWWRLSKPRQAVLLNMAYNLGVQGLANFKKMWSAIREDRNEDVVKEMLDSKWARQVKKRSHELVHQWEQDRFLSEEEALEKFWTKEKGH